MNRLTSLGLVPPGTLATSHLCLVPREPRFNITDYGTDKAFPVAKWHASFDRHEWTFYPVVDVLIKLISLEEGQIQNRINAISHGLNDPGRPRYLDLYSNLPVKNPYSCYFSTDLLDDVVMRVKNNPQIYSLGRTPQLRPDANERELGQGNPIFPILTLSCHVNVVVMSRTFILGKKGTPTGIDRPAAVCEHAFTLFCCGNLSSTTAPTQPWNISPRTVVLVP
jgi:hypothetical protein